MEWEREKNKFTWTETDLNQITNIRYKFWYPQSTGPSNHKTESLSSEDSAVFAS